MYEYVAHVRSVYDGDTVRADIDPIWRSTCDNGSVNLSKKRPDLAARNRGAGGLYEDREWFRRRYEDDDRTFAEMAAEAGCGLRTIARWIRIHSIPVQDPYAKRDRRGNTRRGSTLPPSLCSCGSFKCRESSTCMDCYDKTGQNNPKWRGDAIGVGQAHNRVKSARGKATEHDCLHCSGPAAHWAYDHEDPDERPSDDGPYSVNVAHYLPLCVPCHKRFDLNYLRQKAPA